MSRSKKKYSRQNDVQTQQINNSATDQTQNTPLTTAELFDVLKFAEETYNYAYGGYAPKFDRFGAYTPYLANERLSEIGLSPKKVSDKQLNAILDSPISNQNELVGYSEWLKFNDMIAKRTLGYLGNLPAFDYTFTCTNINDPSEYYSQEYKDDLKIVKDFLSKFDVRGQFSYVNRRTFETDAFYSVFRMDGDHYEFQELPYQNCKITGRSLDWGFQFDFDMNWFLKMGLSFDQYPSIFKKMYDRVMTAKYGDKYDPSNPLEKRKGTFALWAQTSSLPSKGNFACFKMNSDMYASMPYLTPMFQDSINRPIVRKLAMNQYIIAAQKIMIGLIPLLKDQKSGQIKDALAVSPETMGRFLGLLKQGLSDAIKITGAPFEDVKQVEFEMPSTNMYDQSNSIEAASSGATSRIIYASDRSTATEIEYSIGVDSLIATSVYPQYEKWLSSQINFFTKKYKFRFKFEGTKFHQDRERRKKSAIEFANMGLFNEQKLAASMGMDVFELQGQLEMGHSSRIFNLLRLPPNTHTASLGSVESGRPSTEVPSDSAERNLDRIVENKLDERLEV